MALIKCSECGKEISDKALSCINCGCPIESMVNTSNIEPKLNIKGIEYNIASVVAYKKSGEDIKAIKELREITGLGLLEAKNFVAELDLANNVKINLYDDPVCPKCGSSKFQLVTRKWSLGAGLLTNKVDRVCTICKHKF